MNQLSPARRRLTLVFTVLLLASLACTLPGMAAETPQVTPSPEKAVSGGKPRQQIDAPPALVETDPPAGSEIAPDAALTFYFNQAMDRAAVESALQGQPQLSGRYEWLDDATLRFTSDQPYPVGAELRLSLGTGARAANGLALPDPVEMTFQVADVLKVIERLPLPGTTDANPTSAVAVTFNRPVIALGEEQSPPAFQLDPPAEGRGEWLNTSTYIFYPQPSLAGGAQYRVTLDPNLVSTSGTPLDLSADPIQDWTFSTTLPQVISVSTGERDNLELDGEVTVTFNQPLDKPSVEAALSLLAPDGTAVPLSYTWDEAGREVKVKPTVLLARATAYTLFLSRQARSLGGASFAEDTRYTLVSVPDLAVASTNPAPGVEIYALYGFGSYVINFTAPLARQEMDGLVTVSPPISGLPASISYDSYALTISGSFQPATTYTVTLSGELTDRWGDKLGQPVVLTVRTSTPPPSLTVPAMQAGASALYAPLGAVSVPANVTNIYSVQVTRRALSMDEFASLIGYMSEDPAGYDTLNWTQSFNVTADRSTPVDLWLGPGGSAPATGLYSLRVNADSLEGQPPRPFPLIVSRVNLTLKLAGDQVVVWAVDLETREALSGLPVRFFTLQDGDLGQCVTAADGLCSVGLGPRAEVYSAVYAMSAAPGEANFGLVSSEMGLGINPWELGIPVNYYTPTRRAYLYSDRPIYRAGQTIHFRAVLRNDNNTRYALPEGGEVEVRLVPPYDPARVDQQPLYTVRLPITEFGTLQGSFELPESAAPGYYAIDMPEWEANLSLQVAEYRKPEFDLQAAFDKPAYRLGESFTVRLDARYYFDVPVGDLPFSWSLFTNRDWVYLPDGLTAGAYDDSWLYPREYTMQGNYLTGGEGVTAPDGSAVIEIPAGVLDGITLNNRRTLNIEITAQDETGFPVSVRTQAQLHPADFYIGVRPDSWSAQAGVEIGYTLQTLDWENQPAGAHNLTAVFYQVAWVPESEQGIFGYRTYRKELTEVSSTDLRTDTQGRARVAFTPPQAGTFQLSVSGEGALTEDLLWVSGPGTPVWPSLPSNRLRLESDAASYAPGQTASIRIPNPFPGNTLALISVERSQVMRTEVRVFNQALETVEIPLQAIDAPNVFVSVTLVGEDANGRPGFRQGVMELIVDSKDLALNVQAAFDPPRAGPGDAVTLNLLAFGPDGKPVRAEFSLALVDKAVLALADPNAPPIFEAFYARRPLGVITALNLTNYAELMPASAPGRGGGGGDGMVNLVRSNFKDTAYWSGSLITDAEGRASVPLRLPDNLTTWVADLRGLTADTLVGAQSLELVASKDLMVRPVTPRFLMSGDRVQLGAVVQNNTAGPLSVDVSLEAPGLTLEDPAAAQQSVEVPAGGRVRVNWWGTAQPVDALDPIFSARSGGLSDVTHAELAPIPVLGYTTGQTVATAGVLAEAGKRLEAVSLPRTFTPTGGQLRVELSPSLAATVLQSLEALKSFPDDFNEPIISRVLANAAAYQAVRAFNLQTPDLQNNLEAALRADLRQMLEHQSYDGGWNWSVSYQESDAHLTAYGLIALEQARLAGFLLNTDPMKRAQEFLKGKLFIPSVETGDADLERLALMHYALANTAADVLVPGEMLNLRERLSPSGKALLAMALENINAEQSRSLLSDLAGLAQRSATGANWQAGADGWATWSTPVQTTAVVSYALARLDPASPLLVDAMRYLALNRRPNGCWSSSYESAWVLLALSQTLSATGDLEAAFAFQSTLNGAQIAAGEASGAQGSLTTQVSSVPLEQLATDATNALEISREAGPGRLYYRVYLDVERPAGEAPALSRGIFVEREYFTGGVDCRETACLPVNTAEMGSLDGLVARVTVTLPQDMYYLVVEDFVPAGAEVINPNLKTSRQGFVDEGIDPGVFDPWDSFSRGWGYWLFGPAVITDSSVRWMAPFVPAGTYTLTYRLSPALAGDFQTPPARAYQYYFPEVEGRSAGSVLQIR